MATRTGAPLERLKQNAAEAAEMLKVLAHEGRLVALCHLARGERSVGELEELTGLSQSAISQHLARMRALGLAATRRDGQTIYYRLADPRVSRLLRTIYDIYCE